jgi:hypothetical protein
MKTSSGGAGNWPGNSGSTGGVSISSSMAHGKQAIATVSRRVISDAHLLDDALYEDESHEIANLLSSTVTSQKLDGLKRLIACISVGRDVSDFFPNVVVNVAHVPFEVRGSLHPTNPFPRGGLVYMWGCWLRIPRVGHHARGSRAVEADAE